MRENVRNAPIHIQRALCDKRKVQRGAPDRAQRVGHDAMRRSTGQARETAGLATNRFLRAVRAPLDRDERTGQRGQRPRARRRKREALWGPNGRAECGGRVGVQEGAGAAHACVEVLEEGVVDHA